MRSVRENIISWFIIGILIFFVISTAIAADNELTITTSSWNDRRDILEVKGNGQSRLQVIVTDTDSTTQPGTTTVSRSGKWSLRVKNLTSIPCSVTATSGAETVKQSVQNAPDSCSNPPSLIPDVSINSTSQNGMPGISGPYNANVPQEFSQFVKDQAFFISPDFQFGYVSEGVDWFEAAGIPLTAYDDFGRENPWPLYRIQAINRMYHLSYR